MDHGDDNRHLPSELAVGERLLEIGFRDEVPERDDRIFLVEAELHSLSNRLAGRVSDVFGGTVFERVVQCDAELLVLCHFGGLVEVDDGMLGLPW